MWSFLTKQRIFQNILGICKKKLNVFSKKLKDLKKLSNGNVFYTFEIDENDPISFDDLGKILCLFGEEQWAVVGDTFPLGCKFSEKIVFHEFFSANSDFNNPNYSSELGIYQEGCGLSRTGCNEAGRTDLVVIPGTVWD